MIYLIAILALLPQSYIFEVLQASRKHDESAFSADPALEKPGCSDLESKAAVHGGAAHPHGRHGSKRRCM